MDERVPSVAEAVADYLQSMAVSGRSTESCRARRYLLVPLRDLDCSVLDIDRQLCNRLILERRQRVQASSVRTFSQGLSAFLTFCVEQGWLAAHPMATIKRPKAPKKPQRYLSLVQLRSVLNHCKDDYERLAVILMAGSGLRIGEVIDIRWDRINFSEGSIEVLGKGDKWRGIDASRAMPIFERLPRRGKFVYRITAFTLRTRIQRLGREIGLSWQLRPHELRHSFAVGFLEASEEDGFTLQSILGHSSSDQTEHYIRAVRQKAAIRKMQRVNFAGHLFGE